MVKSKKNVCYETNGDLTENRTPSLRMKILCPKPLDDEAKLKS